jgi:hypothetical protein
MADQLLAVRSGTCVSIN